MTQINERTKQIVRWIWSHIAAAVAVMLIFGALLIGIKIGTHTPSTTTMSMNQTDSEEHEHDLVPVDDSPQLYTCSMHPNVRLEDPNAKCPICFMALIPVTDNAGGDGSERQLVLSESAKAMSRIETTKVERFFPTANVRLYGKLTYDETSVARISAYFPGRIDRLFVNYIGIPVQAGDHLAEMYSPDLLAAFEELRQAKKSVDDSTNASEFLRDTSNQTLQAVREKLRLFGLTQHQIDDIESGTFDSDQLTIYSPIGGIVTHLSTREGDYLKTGDLIATVADLSRLWLDLEAYESQLPMLHWGLKVTFTVEAHPGEVFEGKISFIEPIVDDRTRTAAVRVAVDNTNNKLKPGMFATAVAHPQVSATGAVMSDDLSGKWIGPMHPTVIKDEPGTCDVCGMDLISAEAFGIVGDPSTIVMPLVIPRSAVLFTGTRSVVYIQVPNTDQPTYEGRIVEIGPLAGEFYTVRSGLSINDEVVTHGAFRIDSAMQIIAKPSMMMPDGGRSNTGHQHGDQPAPTPTMSMLPPTKSLPPPPIPDSFIEQLSPIYDAYLEAQERLADDDLEGFIAANTQLAQAVGAVNPSALPSNPQTSWHRIHAQLEPDEKSTEKITTIDDARIRFETMSLAIIELEKQFGHAGDETWHVAFCPMAFDFKGAQWLQRTTEINNPYFGDSMLRCGDIQHTFAPINTPSTEMNNNEHKGHTDE